MAERDGRGRRTTELPQERKEHTWSGETFVHRKENREFDNCGATQSRLPIIRDTQDRIINVNLEFGGVKCQCLIRHLIRRENADFPAEIDGGS